MSTNLYHYFTSWAGNLLLGETSKDWYGDPVLGFAGPEGLIIAAGFKSSVVIAPAVGEIVADLVTKGSTFCDLSEFTDQSNFEPV